MAKATAEKPQPNKPLYKLTGVASFPFLARTAKNEKVYPEDKYKLDLNVDESSFEENDFSDDVLEMGREWFNDDELDLNEICPSIKFLNEDLDEDDKYVEYKRDKVRVRAKSTAKQQPNIYDADKTVLTSEEDIDKIGNGAKVNMFLAPYCFGDQEKYLSWEKKLKKAEGMATKTKEDEKKRSKLIKKVLEAKPIFGIALGLQGVQYLGGSSGRAASKAQQQELLDDVEVSVEDVEVDGDDGDDEEVDLD